MPKKGTVRAIRLISENPTLDFPKYTHIFKPSARELSFSGMCEDACPCLRVGNQLDPDCLLAVDLRQVNSCTNNSISFTSLT